MATASAEILVHTAGAVTTLVIARPEKRNALTAAMYTALAEALLAADRDEAVRAVIITGQPGVFTAGNDLEDFLMTPPAGPDAPVFRFMHALADCRKPVVAAVCGPAVGIGTTLLLHCDLVYVATDAKLATPFTGLGLVAEYASSLLLTQRAGHVRAAQWLLLGDRFNGVEAAAQGLANAALPAEEVLPAAEAAAARLAALPAGAVQETKALMRRAERALVRETIAVEAEAFGRRLHSPEAKAAFSAFLKR
jgi:enoyl-CoA hydratase/carnithine racemase